jgi:omega-amidase
MSVVNVSLIQAPLLWHKAQQNIAYFTDVITHLPTSTHVVVLPEMYNSGFTMQASEVAEAMQGPTVQWMQALSTQCNKIIVGSLAILDNEKYYNRAIWCVPNGGLHYYDKRHLFALAGEHKVYTPGKQRVIVQVNGIKILLQICYDLRFPVYSRQQANQYYDAILYIANWPTKRIAAWDALLQARAIENQCVVMGVNRIGIDGNDTAYNGHTSVYDSLGNRQAILIDEAGIINYTINNNDIQEVRNQLPFLMDGDSFTIY